MNIDAQIGFKANWLQGQIGFKANWLQGQFGFKANWLQGQFGFKANLASRPIWLQGQFEGQLGFKAIWLQGQLGMIKSADIFLTHKMKNEKYKISRYILNPSLDDEK